MEEDIKIHMCTEIPCPLRDRECLEILENGFTSNYTKEEE